MHLRVVLTTRDEIKVRDFGTAGIFDSMSAPSPTGTSFSTAAYLAPEQAMGLVAQLDHRVDLFAVGAMMHALLTGHRINDASSEVESIVIAATKAVPSVSILAPQLPAPVARVIDTSLQWDRRRRYASAGEMRDAVTAAIRSCCSN